MMTMPLHAQQPILRKTLLATSVGALFLAHTTLALANEQLAAALPSVDVISTTPLPGIGIEAEKLPFHVQSLNKEALNNSQGDTLTNTLNKNLGSVFINDIQNNPYQPDVNYRGFTASPLLGTAQGLSVYVDGVRLNQPFGDVVSWDLLPRSAFSSLDLIPGSNPVYGLNTLGGAISITTKDGRTHAGSSVQATMGSNSRRTVEFEHGGNNQQGWHWFITGNSHRDNGWRVDSPTDVRQLFTKVGWGDSKTDLAATVAVADNALTGNGLQEYRLLQNNYSSVYTKPDETDNRSIFINLSGSRSLNDVFTLSGNAYYRKIKTTTFNGDINDDSLNQNTYLTGTGNTALTASNANRQFLANNGFAGQFPATAEDRNNTPFPFWACIANVGLMDEPFEKCNALINRSTTNQDNSGVSGQLSAVFDAAGIKHNLTAGVAYDFSSVRYSQTQQAAYLTPDRGVVGVNAFADGTYLDDTGLPLDNRVNLEGHTRTWSIYGTDTMSLSPQWHLTAAGRLNHTEVKNRDLLLGSGPGSLTGDHNFSRFNPAVGVSYTPASNWSGYASYNEGSRTPSAIELGCADPANPCKLPNALAGDPALKQVVTKTKELGLNGKLSKGLRWNAGVFRADNTDDLLFVADNAAGFGYFKNFGQTRRQGVELGLSGEQTRFNWGMNLTFLDATFQSQETVNGAANSTQDANGNIQINKGNKIPLIPGKLFKARTQWEVVDGFKVGASMFAAASSYARGNENNAHQPDGVFFVGDGKAPGYAVFDLNTEYRLNRKTTLFAQINNLFDREYANAAQLGATGIRPDGTFVARPFGPADNNSVINSTFYAPGAQRTFWVGARFKLD